MTRSLLSFSTINIFFLWALAIRRIERKAYSHLWLNKKYTRGPLIAIELLRIALAVFFVGFLIYQFYNTIVAVSIALALIVIGMVVFSRKLQTFYERMEFRFLNNLNAREQANKQPEILPWDSHLLELIVAPESTLVGQTITSAPMALAIFTAKCPKPPIPKTPTFFPGPAFQ